MGLRGVSRSMLGTEGRVEKAGFGMREKISHGQNQGVNVSEHVL